MPSSPVFTLCRMAWNILKYRNREIPKIRRYNGKAISKGKIQKTDNPKAGRKSIKWHTVYNPPLKIFP